MIIKMKTDYRPRYDQAMLRRGECYRVDEIYNGKELADYMVERKAAVYVSDESVKVSQVQKPIPSKPVSNEKTAEEIVDEVREQAKARRGRPRKE